MPNPTDYIAEVFGFPSDVRDTDVEALRAAALCPFRPLPIPDGAPANWADRNLACTSHPLTEQFGRCTKGKKENPLGVCSVYARQPGTEDRAVCITCPVRFGEGDIMTAQTKAWAASHLGDKPARDLVHIPEVKLVPAARDEGDEVPEGEATDTSAGNIDYVIADITESPQASASPRWTGSYTINSYAALEVQAVYISGNVSKPFWAFMDGTSWDGKNTPRPDWLSSSRKRLIPQLAWKGSVLNHWGRPIAVCVQEPFWATMPYLHRHVVPAAEDPGELAWVLVDLERTGRYFKLKHTRTLCATFQPTLDAALRADPGYDHLLRVAIRNKNIQIRTGAKPTKRP